MSLTSFDAEQFFEGVLICLTLGGQSLLTKEYGTGVFNTEAHVFQSNQRNVNESYDEVLVENPIAILLKNVKTSLSAYESEIIIGEKKTIEPIDMLQINPENLFPDVSFGNIVKFSVTDDQLVASIPGQISPGVFIGEIAITYQYKDKMYQAKKLEYVSAAKGIL